MKNEELKPKIRFKGYNNNWSKKKIKEVLVQRIEHQTISFDAPLLAFSYAEGVINPEDKKTNKRDFLMTDKYNKIFSRTEKDDIIYNPANIIHGAIHRNKLQTGVVSPIYKIFKCNNANPKYLGEYLHTDAFITEIAKYIEGTVIKLRTLSPEMFLDMNIKIPEEIEEQKKIGDFFEIIDSLILKEQQKYDKLVETKKALLNKMFPIKPLKVPKIRFKEFNNDWEERRFDSIFEYERPDKYIVKSDKYNNFSRTPVLTANKAFILGYTDEKNTYKKESESIIFDDFTLEAKFVDFPFMVKSSAIKILTLKDKSNDNLRFNYELLCNTKFNILGHARHYISVVQPEEIRTTSKEEQEKIGEFFHKIDVLEELYGAKIEKLKNAKKALLNMMLV